MTDEKPVVVEIMPSIDEANQLQLTFRDVNNKLVSWRPGTGLTELAALRGNALSLTLEVIDFYQFGSLYASYGAALVADTPMVAAHWEATQRGQRYTLEIPGSGGASPRLLIGAVPRMPGAPVPATFRSWLSGSDGLPEDEPRPKGQ